MTPAPTTPAEEIKLLNLVTQIATQIRDMGEQNAGLREQVTSMRSSFTSRLDDLERRISLNEATQAVKGMRGGEPEQAVQPRPTPTPAPRNAEEPVALAPGGLSGAGVGVPVADWKVEGASPRMVVLGAASGGPPKIVKLGEEIDGRYGKVTKITQNATSGRWTVFAERGALVQGGR